MITEKLDDLPRDRNGRSNDHAAYGAWENTVWLGTEGARTAGNGIPALDDVSTKILSRQVNGVFTQRSGREHLWILVIIRLWRSRRS